MKLLAISISGFCARLKQKYKSKCVEMYCHQFRGLGAKVTKHHLVAAGMVAINRRSPKYFSIFYNQCHEYPKYFLIFNQLKSPKYFYYETVLGLFNLAGVIVKKWRTATTFPNNPFHANPSLYMWICLTSQMRKLLRSYFATFLWMFCWASNPQRARKVLTG